MKRLVILITIILTVLLSSCGGSSRLLNFPFDSGGRSLNSPAAELTPRVSGRYIVFSSDRFGRQDIYLFDMVSRRLVDLPGLNSFDAIASSPALSKNGRYIVFASNRQGKSGIFLYDRETRQLRNLTTNLQAEVRNPTISADGNRIAFESSANGQWDILVYDRAGQPINIPTEPQ
ncbi:TolB family protein [Chroogloeocystis siderophila]|uniref:Tol biopolymer transporter periplasmic protein n=1 Tax=Chroogloeocystis siderophila 5.2 s.c.1 TaxID=247279 RepID=A0A1U7HVK8_9CHRO|nr:TolB family protein [Chroogloeocystis siderophila]OKH27607.1 Tol biopolymer transporter periplasmic protein [Chroogloeocystis siderophila 5.2 s.c.1]